MNRRNSHQSNNSIDSDHSSPPDSPYGSNQHLNPPNTGMYEQRGHAYLHCCKWTADLVKGE